jgi:DNA-directed RNA polymerase subunit F
VYAKILNVLPKYSHELRSIDKNRGYAPKVYALLELPELF